MKLSDWQNGFPPCNGIWQILVPEHISNKITGIYYARFKDGEWDTGFGSKEDVLYIFQAYPSNNNPNNPRQWRGLIDE